MPKVKRIQKVKSSNPDQVGDELAQAGAGLTGYTASRLAGKIIKTILGKQSVVLQKGSKVLAAAGALAAIYQLTKKSGKLKKYRTAAITGAVIALVQAIIEEFLPQVGGLIDIGPASMGALPPQAQAQAHMAAQAVAARAQAESKRTFLRSPEDDYLDSLEAQEEIRRGGGRVPQPVPQQPPSYAQRPQGPAVYPTEPQGPEEVPGPGPEYDDEDSDLGAGIFSN